MSAIPRLGAGDVAEGGHQPIALSRRLLGPLEMIAGRARVMAIFLACFQWAVVTGLAWVVVVLLLGLFPQMPMGLAVLLSLAGWLVVLGGAVYFFRRVFRRGDASDAARLVDAAIPESQERFLSALELAQDEDARFRGSPELIAVLVRQVENAAKRIDPNVVVPGKRVFHWFLLIVPVLAVWFVLLVVMTPTIVQGMQRLFMPWVVPVVLPAAKLEVDPRNVTIAQGDQVMVGLKVTALRDGKEAPAIDVKHASITRRSSAGGTDQDVTSDMEPTGDRTFRAIFDNVQQAFSYRVESEGVQSPTYFVTVQPRPAAATIQFDYTFPAYTGRSPRTVISRDGTMDALVGTQVVVTVEASEPVKSAQMAITDNAPYAGLVDLLPVGGSNTKFSTNFMIRKTTEYHLQMVDMQGLENSDNQARAITARLDAPPTIAIVSPTDAELKVTPEDVVPVKYSAEDDFGLTRIEALVRVDEGEQALVRLPAKTPAEMTANGTWALSLHDLLNGPGVAGKALAAKKITYQLKATDNRDPEPQVGLSAKQTLVIDRTAVPLAERLDAQAARSLSEAVARASSELQDAKDKLDELRKTAAGRPLTEEEKQKAADARRDLTNAGQILQLAADKTNDSRLAESAKQAKEIADQPIREARENTAASQLAADQPEARGKSLDAASQNIADAQKRLDKLGREVGEQAKDQPLARELERIASEQKRLADALAQSPNDPKLLAQQKRLQQDLEKVIKDHPELQKPAADAAEAKNEEVQKQIEDLKQSQKPLNEQAQNQVDASNIQDKLNDLAKKQQDLNQKIGQFTQQQADPLKQASGRPPDASQLDPIVKEIQARKLPEAGQAQSAAASKLDETARQLAVAQERQTEQAGMNARLAQQAGQNAKDAEALRGQAEQLRQKIDEAQKNHNPPTRPSDPANQDATRLADAVKREAQQMGANPADKEAAKGAADEADAAKKDAARGDASSAQQHLANAANRLSDASHTAQTSAEGNSSQAVSQAAREAKDLADQQRSLAEQTQAAGKSLEDAASAKGNADQSAQQQQQLANKMDQAAESARQLQKQTQGAAPEVSDRAGKASDSLQKAAQAQRAAAQATESGNSSQAANQQKEAAGQLAQAEQTLGGKSNDSGQSQGQTTAQSSPSGGHGSGDSKSAAEAVQAARNAQSQAAGGNPMAARQAADQLSHASQQLAEGNGGGEKSASPNGSGSGQSSGKPIVRNDQLAGGMQEAGTGANSSGVTAAAGNGNGNGNGARIATAGGGAGEGKSAAMPKAVEEIGVSPSDWARLPANAQEQLLNSAQQSGPPAYREMIKNYYSRIAHLDEQGENP